MSVLNTFEPNISNPPREQGISSPVYEALIKYFKKSSESKSLETNKEN